jgi:hypothetical protein
MKPIPVFLAGWALGGLGTVLGSMLGNTAGRTGLYAGAVVGGLMGIGAAVYIAVRLGWLDAVTRVGALAGGVVGFALAVPLAVRHLDTPVTPVLSAGLIGAGLLVGAGYAGSRTRGG